MVNRFIFVKKRLFLGKYSSYTAFSLILITLCSLVMLYSMHGSLLVIWDRILPPYSPKLALQQDVTVLDFHAVGGVYYVYLAYLPYHLLVYFFNLFSPVGIANSIVFWLLFLTSGFSMYLFVSKTVGLTGKAKSFVALIASLAYMFNPFVIFTVSSWPLLIFLMAFLPLLMLTIREVFVSADSSIKRAVKYSILSALVSVPMIPGIADLPTAGAAISFIFLYLVFLSIKYRKLKSLIITIALVAIFVISANIWWIIPNLLHSGVQNALARTPSYVAASLASLQYWQPYMTYFNVLRGMAYKFSGFNPNIILPGVATYNSGLFILISLLTPLIGSLSLISTRLRNRSDVLPLAMSLVVFIPLFLTGLNPPFGFLIEWAVHNLPFYVFRNSSMYMFTVSFVFSYMFCLGMYTLYCFLGKLNKPRNKSFRNVITLVLLFLVIGANAFPQWLGNAPNAKIVLFDQNGKPTQVSTLVQVPDYVNQMISFLNNAPDQGDVLILPLTDHQRGYNWANGAYGIDVYYTSLNRRVLDSYAYDTGHMDSYVDALNELIQQGNPSDDPSFIQILNNLNIKYIIVTEDALSEGTPFNISQIEGYLSSLPDIRFVVRFGMDTLFETIETPSLFNAVTQSEDIYSLNQTDLNNQTLDSLSFGPSELFEKNFYQTSELSTTLNSPLADSINIQYNYTEERGERAENAPWIATLQTYTTMPFYLNATYDYLLVSLKTQPGVIARISITNDVGSLESWEDSLGPFLTPLNPNDESINASSCISTNSYYTFIFKLPQSFNQSNEAFIKIGLEPMNYSYFANYALSIQNVSFARLFNYLF